MEISEYRNIYDNEGGHFFYVSTHELVVGLIKKWIGRKKLSILDAGCGTGGLLSKLKRFGEVSGIDFSPEAVKFARKRDFKVTRASVEKIPYPDKTFDLVTSIDVIYHRAVVSDSAALAEFYRVLKPDGSLVLRVPANKFLMSAHDRHVHTARRYSKKELDRKLHQAGFVVKYISFVHSPIFLFSLMRLIVERLTHKQATSTIGKVNPVVNSILKIVLGLEADVACRGVAIPFGQGLIAVATKKG